MKQESSQITRNKNIIRFIKVLRLARLCHIKKTNPTRTINILNRKLFEKQNRSRSTERWINDVEDHLRATG